MIRVPLKLALQRGVVALPLCFLLARCPATGAVVVGLGQNFTATTFGVDSTAIPPDCNGAVGPTHYVELINGRFSVFDKATASRVQSFTDLTFWSQAGVTIPPRWDITDPRIIYDAVSQRWFAVQVDFDTYGIINSNHFLLAVSATKDPTGAWQGVAVTADPTVSSTADFPTLGVDSDGVYVSGDMFDVHGNLVGTTLISIPKADLLAPTPSIARLTRFANLSVASRGIVFQPAVTLDRSAGANILATASLGFDLITGNPVTSTDLIAFTVQNAAGASATLSSSTSLTVPGYTGPLNPPQPGVTSQLSDGDARFSASVYCVGGALYAVHNTEVNGRAALRWYRISSSTAVILDSGTVTDSVLDLYYPSIAANTNGTVVIGCNGSSSTTYVSCYAMVGETVNGVTTFGKPLLLKAGVIGYLDGTGNPESRWGDYSTTTVDATDPGSFWTIQMYPSDVGTWSTQVTQIRTAPLRLNIATAGTNVLLSWTSLAGSAQLQTQANGSSSNSWSTVAQSPATNGNLISVLVPSSSNPRFFRLKL